MRPNRRALATSAATAVLLLTAACGGANPEPAPLPKASTPSASPTATATPLPPAMPAAAKVKTKAGAIAFAKHYVQLINHAQSTGDVDPLVTVESSQCTSCKSVEGDLRELYSSGGSLRGGAWQVSQVLGSDLAPRAGRVVSIVVSFGPQTIRRTPPEKSQRLKGGTLPLTLNLASVSTGWQITEWTRAR